MRPLMSAYPQVGSVMRDRIFRSVLFPAPFRPISPTTSPCLISKVASLERPEDLVEIGGARRRPAHHPPHAPERRGADVDHRIPQRAVPALLEPADVILLSEAFRLNGNRGHLFLYRGTSSPGPPRAVARGDPMCPTPLRRARPWRA